MNEGPSGTVTDKVAAPAAEDPLAGFSEAFNASAHPPEVQGEPEGSPAAETSEEEKAPAAETETPKAEKAEEPAKEEEKPDPAQTVSFDGFSDAQKTTWERLLKAGHVTPEEVQRARDESLFQRAWTKKTTALSEERKAFKAEMTERREDLALLDKIRSDDRLHAWWMKAAKGEFDGADPEADEFIDAKKAREIVRQERKAETQRTAKEQAAYDEKRTALEDVVKEQTELLSIPSEAMNGYLKSIRAALPEGVDPITYLRPDELQDRITIRHEAALAKAALAKAEAAKAKEQSSKRTSQESRTAKQSLPPARRVAATASMTPLQKTEADLGLDPGWSNVQGFGFRDAH